MRRIFLYLILVFASYGLVANEQELLDSAKNLYIDNDYYEALLIYESLVEENYISPELYYNLGNCYYKSELLAPAIYYYEKALKLSPGDEDIKHNLKIAYSKITNQVNAVPEMFYIKWYNSVRNQFSSNTWAWISIIAFVFTLLIIILVLMSKRRSLKKIGIYLSIFLGLIAIVSFSFAYSQKKYQLSRSQAIVFEAAMVKSSPSLDGNNLFEIQEGLKVQIIDTLDNWSQIRIADGKRGWVQSGQIRKF
jgi:tetratricopeptide (TPR) repeat protein